MNNKSIYSTVTVLFILYIATVLFFCLFNLSMDSIDMAKYIWGIRLDRVFHFLMFLPCPFIFWLFYYYNKTIKINKGYLFAVVLLSGIIFGALTEAAQEVFTTYRDGDPYDLGANITGILVGTLIVYILRKPLELIINKIFDLNKK